MADTEFKKWVGTSAGESELEAYKGAMDMINTSAEDKQALNSVLVNGFADPDLIEAMKGVLEQ